MFITDLKLTNFKNFQNFSIKFNRGINVIAGENGFGKSAILSAIAKGIGGNPFYNPEVSKERNQKKRKTEFNLIAATDVRKTDSLYDAQYPLKIELSIRRDQNNSVFMATRSLSSMRKRENDFNFLRLYPEFNSMTQAKKDRKSVALPLVRFYSTERIYKVSQKRKVKQEIYFSDRLSAYHECMLPNSKYNFVDYWLKGKGLDYLMKYVGADKTTPIIDGLYSIVPGLSIAGLTHNIDDGIIYKFKNSSSAFPIEMLSDGQKTLVGMIADLLLRCVVLNFEAYGREVFEETSGIVLIDEIDLHLHPKWQQEIIGNLRNFFPKIQFIISTHSPFILQSLELNELKAFSSNLESLNMNNIGLSLEEVAEEIQGIEHARLSSKKRTMLVTAEQIFKSLKEAKKNGISNDAKRKLSLNLMQSISEYSDDVAYYAFLKINILDELNINA